jgi:hypothetical protein
VSTELERMLKEVIVQRLEIPSQNCTEQVTKHTRLLTQNARYLGRALNVEHLQSKDATQLTANFFLLNAVCYKTLQRGGIF